MKFWQTPSNMNFLSTNINVVRESLILCYSLKKRVVGMVTVDIIHGVAVFEDTIKTKQFLH